MSGFGFTSVRLLSGTSFLSQSFSIHCSMKNTTKQKLLCYHWINVITVYYYLHLLKINSLFFRSCILWWKHFSNGGRSKQGFFTLFATCLLSKSKTCHHYRQVFLEKTILKQYTGISVHHSHKQLSITWILP